MPRPYVPIACDFHDRLEHHAVRGVVVTLSLEANDGAQTLRARVADVFARVDDGVEADWVRLVPEDGSAGFEVRADAVRAVDGVPAPDAC